jgi:hypothetical protein
MFAEGVAKKEAQLLSNTCASLRTEVEVLREHLSQALRDTETTRQDLLQSTREYETLRVSSTQSGQLSKEIRELQQQLEQEREKLARSSAKVKELRLELLQVASDADKTIGEERGAKEVAEREAQEAKKQLARTLEKYKEKDDRLHEVRVCACVFL